MANDNGGDDLSGLFGGAGGGSADTGGAGTGDAGAQADAGGEGDGGAEGGAAPDFFAKLSTAVGDGETVSNRDWAQAAGIKDLDGLAKIARDNQRALRDSGRVKVPGEGAKADEIAAWRKAIGVPDDAKGYEIKGPDGVALNQPLIDRLAGAAQQAGIPKGAFETTVGEFIQAQIDEAAETEKTLQAQVGDKLKEWGGKRTENEAHVLAATRALGLNRADQLWMRTMPGGAGRALDLLVKLGSSMAEDTLVSGGKGGFNVGGADAQAQIDAMRGDPETLKRMMTKGTAENARYERLNRAAAEHKVRTEAA